MENRTPRKRIPIERNAQPAVVDPMEFKPNKSSDKAREITTINENLSVKVWFDKHYHDRHQHGDDNGKREGIDHDVVKALAIQVVKHLIFYAGNVKGFNFINYGEPDPNGWATRVVCQQVTDGNTLNVIIEVHYISLVEYEITVKTAMRKNDFKVGDGQYTIEVIDGDNSILRFMSKNKLVEVCSI